MIGKKLIIIFRLFILCLIGTIFQIEIFTISSHALSGPATNTARQIADICSDHWDEYGVLPSVAIAQAFVESGLGTGGSNLFGVNGCRGLDVYDSTIRYLQCINNGYYPYAPFQTDPEIQISYILSKGRYCENEYPGGSYHSNVLSSIHRYNWTRFDDRMFKQRKKEALRNKRKVERESRESIQWMVRGYRIVFSDAIPVGTAIVDPEYIKKGSTILCSYGIFEVCGTKRRLGNTLLLGRGFHNEILFELFKKKYLSNYKNISNFGLIEDLLCPLYSRIEVIENAVG